MRRLVYLLVLFVMFITTARAEIFYSTLKIGEQTTLNAYASPSSNHYVSKYEWQFPSVCVTPTEGGSRFDSYCKILATGATIILVLGIVAILVGVWMLLLSASDYIKCLRRFADNPIMRFVPIVVMIVIYIIVMKNQAYVQSLHALESNVRLAKQLGTSANYSAGKGIGPVLYIIGLAVYTIGTVGDFLARKRKIEG